MAREFEIRREVELPATPEEVWAAVASAPGTASWMFPTDEPEPRVGGAAPHGGKVTAWDPPHRFAVRTESEDGSFNALEYVLEGRGGTTVLRYVHSGTLEDESWDSEYDAANQHTDFYLHTLAEYLRHFKGRAAVYVGQVPGGIDAPASSAAADGFARLRTALGVDGGAAGDRVSLPGPAAGAEGVVDYADENFLGVRTGDALYRFFGRNAFGWPVGMQVHVFAEGADAAALERAWQQWLDGVYAGT